ncbi:FAD-binding and (Fe-S)-binding domain-containing protein [Demequina sp. NBRC 110054]|uniref:FAD-binding and (Fe-S)-binding domain-containing protein n=1 Tax=Demequina sp. NBRC 110054 TaxID=1570343 RepID=UPI000A0262DA|nr:FAD-binding and (Fe-S)-binding domain-containing protein [Demequina sp. NBRC 110054]
MANVTATTPAADLTDSDDGARALVSELRMAGVDHIETGTRRRAEYSTDASNYRVVPQLVAFPRDVDELLAIHSVSRTTQTPLTMRGAGTSVAGNSIGTGIVVDTSRYLNQILDVDVEARTARVQPGVIMGDLQRVIAPHGLRFGPDPSTWTRCTLGGMIGNNACGPHALAFGRTADNVLSLDVIDGVGRRFNARAKADDAGAAGAVGRAGGPEAVPGLKELVDANLALIRTEFGRFTRQVSGYSLEHLLPENGGDLGRFLVGTEGTLGTALEAKLRLVEVPTFRLTGVFAYDDMPAAADAVVPLLPLGAQAIEGLDARLVARVRAAKGDSGVPELPVGAGWLLVEVGAVTEDDAEAQMAAVVAASGTSSYRVVRDGAESAKLWAIRADGAGLAGRTAGNVEAWPGWEDAAVPPERLGAYLRDFDALMDRHGVEGQPFGHFGDGCIHVRLAIPMQEDGRPLRAFMEDSAKLVAEHGGSLSGEHGDGRARSELLGTMYSQAAVQLFGQVKALFDPNNLLNPGIIVDPAPLDADLRRPAAPKTVPSKGGLAFEHDHGDLTEAVHRCTGVGKCRADLPGTGTGFMCPSYAATKDEKDVTRGRARVLQDAINGSLIGGLTAPEVRQSLDACLSCKACSSDCPSGIDMAAYKSEVLHRSYQGKLRPMPHYSIGWLPRWMNIIGWVPWLVNGVMAVGPLRRLILPIAGLDKRRSLPKFAAKPFRRTQVAKSHRPDENSAKASSLGTDRRVVLWADSFTDGLDPEIPTAIVEVLESAGFEVIVSAGDACCGVTWISTGQLDGARKHLEHLLSVLGPYAVNGIPIIGVEPSCTAVLRGDITEILPDDPRARSVALGTYTLAEVLTGRAPVKPDPEWQVPSLEGVDVVVQPHCHQYSVMGYTADRDILARAGANVTEASGCCGLAGNWGYENGHYDLSVDIAHTSLVPALEKAGLSKDGQLVEGADAVYMADGVSCRTQAEQVAGVDGLHLAEILTRAVRGK